MTDLESRLTDLLTRSANSVDVRPDLEAVTHSPPSRARRRYPIVIGIAAAGVAIAFAATQLVPSRDEPTRTTGPTTTEAPSPAVPRYLVTAPGWQVAYLEEYQPDSGEMYFEDPAGASLELQWYSDAEWDSRREDWGVQQPEPPLQVAGREALMTPVEPFAAMWLADGHMFILRGTDDNSADSFRALAGSVAEVDQAAWLQALPADMVIPAERRDFVAATLAGLPVPGDFDPEPLMRSQQVRGTTSTVRIEVTGAVVCAWIDQWIDATADGSGAAKTEAVETIRFWRTWPTTGDYAHGEWGSYMDQLAEAMVADRPTPTNGEGTQGETYLRTMGCTED